MKYVRRVWYRAILGTGILAGPVGVFVSWKLMLMMMLPELVHWLSIFTSLSSTVHQISLMPDKHHIKVRKYNLFGFQTPPEKGKIRIADIRFLGIHVNQKINIGDKGVLTCLSSFLRKKDPDESKSWKEQPNLENKFRYFYKFSAYNQSYLVPVDHSDFTSNIENEELLRKILDGRIFAVYGYNFENSERREEIMEEEKERHRALKQNRIVDVINPKQENRVFEMERKYTDFLRNRQYEIDDEQFRRRPDDVDGTFRDVGYR